jgi:ATP-dependent RNA helicase DDX42
MGFKAEGMHGDLDQHSRMAMLSAFKGGQLHVLVATDVAARGLDIRTIRTVVNYDVAKSIDAHVHRIGRTGRAGDKDGAAFTLLLPNETRMAAALVQNIKATGQTVPQCASNIFWLKFL